MERVRRKEGEFGMGGWERRYEDKLTTLGRNARTIQITLKGKEM